MITEDTSLMECIRMTRTMSIEELKENEAYLYRQRDEVIEAADASKGLEAVKVRIRTIDLNLTRIRSMIGHRHDEYELRTDLPDNITRIQFKRS